MAAAEMHAPEATAVEHPAEQPVKVTAEQLGVSQGEQYSGHLEFDLGNLMASEQGPIDRERFVREPDAACLELATQITQSLVARLFQLPSQAAPVGRIAQLPKPTTPLPRAKPVPQPRAPTKWEAFAQRKGIVKRKRGREVFDEEAGEYRRRHGYKRAGDESEVPIIEASAGDAVGEDPFTKLKQEKKERVREQQKRQLGNIKANAKASGKGGAAATAAAVALPPTLRLTAGLPAHGKGKPVKRKEIKEDIKAASRQAGISTASMGKFDERLPGEKLGERQAGSKRQKFEAVSGSTQAENAKAMGLVDRIIRERADDILDTDRAVRRVEAERHRHIGDKMPKQADSDDEEGPSKGKKGRGKKGGKPTSTKGQRFAGLKRGAGGVAKGPKGRMGRKGKGGSMASGKGAGGKGVGGKGAGKGRPAGKAGSQPRKKR